jgi:selenocysteine lyase/cysteine desulfurase
MIQCNVRRLNIDFLSAGGHKWLLALPGAGFFFCRRELIDEIDIWNPGWTGVTDGMDFLNYDQPYRREASRFEDGAQNFHGIYALGAAIDRFLEIGMSNVEERILALTDRLASALMSRGYTVSSPRGEFQRSGILSFRHPRIDTAELFEQLTAGSIVSSAREGSIRLSPHFYNNVKDIARFLEILPD